MVLASCPEIGRNFDNKKQTPTAGHLRMTGKTRLGDARLEEARLGEGRLKEARLEETRLQEDDVDM